MILVSIVTGPKCKLQPVHLEIACRNIVAAALNREIQPSLDEDPEELVFAHSTDAALSKDVEVRIDLVSPRVEKPAKDPREEIRCALMLIFKSNTFSIVVTPNLDDSIAEAMLLREFVPSLLMRKAIWRIHEEIEKL